MGLGTPERCKDEIPGESFRMIQLQRQAQELCEVQEIPLGRQGKLSTHLSLGNSKSQVSGTWGPRGRQVCSGQPGPSCGSGAVSVPLRGSLWIRTYPGTAQRLRREGQRREPGLAAIQ